MAVAHQMEMMEDIITLDESDDEGNTQSSQSSSIVNGVTSKFSSSATISITNTGPLDLSQFLNFSSTAPLPIPEPAILPRQLPTLPAHRAPPLKINAPFMSRPPFVSRKDEAPKVVTNFSVKNGQANGINKNGYANGVKNGLNGHVNGSNGASRSSNLSNTLTSILTEGNTRKRSLEPLPAAASSSDKRPRLTNKKVVGHGNVNYYTSEPNNKFITQDGEEFAGQFRCTSLNCNKVLSNNVSFMYHLWAHVGFFQHREFTTELDQMTDEKFTRMCNVCLTVFETAFEKTRHYLEVHRGVFQTNCLCHICEISDHDNRHNSMVKHRQNELPYECRRCKFRSSSRLALIDHFAKIHIGTTLLMCPFCPYSTQISASEKIKPIVLAKNYVAHVAEHGGVIAKKCSCCSYKFVDGERFEKHIKCHQVEQHKWPVQAKYFKTLKDESFKTKPRHEQLSLLKCLECSTQFPKAEDHFDKMQKCSRCSFESTCIKAFWNHVYLSDCDPANEERYTYAVVPDENFVPPKCPNPKLRKTLSVMKSKDFIQNFRLFRDFSYDRKPVVKPQIPEVKTEADLTRMRREQLRQMTTARRTTDIPVAVLDGIAENIFGEIKEDSETLDFIKSIRVPSVPLFEEFLAEKKRKEDESPVASPKA